MTVLGRILETKRREITARKEEVSEERLARLARQAPEPRSLSAALDSSAGGIRVIAEVKKASPSRGVLREHFDPLAIALAYEASGAAAISVLTDEEYFQGRLEYLRDIRRNVSLPVLRKDFIIDRYQVWESRAAGADAILLIAAALSDGDLQRLGADAAEAGLEVLWEVHDGEELERVRGLEPRIVGINNRDLRTFEVRLETTRELAPLAPRDALVVSESGFFRHSELVAMRSWGVDAFLVGEGVVKAPDPGAALRDLLGREGTE